MRPDVITPSTFRTPYSNVRIRTISGERGIAGQIGSGLATGTQFLQTSGGIAVRVTKVIFGFMGVVGGALMAALFKEHTAADYGSKILMILGAILGAWGVKDLLNYNKTVTTNPSNEQCLTEVGPELSRDCKKAAMEVSKPQLDPSFTKKYDPINPGLIRLNKTDPNLRNTAFELLEQYTQFELIDHVKTYKSGIPYSIANIDNEVLSLSDYRDRISMLLGYISASGPLDATEPNVRDLVKAILSDVDNYYRKEFNYDLDGYGYAKALPPDFLSLYSASSWYKTNHRGSNNSITNLIGGETMIQLLERCRNTPGVGTTREDTFKYLSDLQQAQNYLSALDRAICYVLDPNNLSDPQKARNVIILRQALICGLGLKGKDLEHINAELDKIHQGEEGAGSGVHGLQAKIKQINNHIQSERFANIINDPAFPFERISSTVTDDPVLNGQIWYEIVSKRPVAVS